MTDSNNIFTDKVIVDQYGSLEPCFDLGDPHTLTSGCLKYFHKYKGKELKITIEVLGNDND